MRILVIGGAGFIGTALLERVVEHNIEVCVLDVADRISRLGTSVAGVTKCIRDFTDLRSNDACFENVDAIIHLGCTTHPKSSMDDPIYDAKTNILASISLLEAAVLHDIGTFVFASSGGTVYGAPDGLPVKEQAPTNPLCAYGISKLAIEKYTNLYSQQYRLRGISLRIGNAYGPYQLRGTAIGSIAHFLRCVAMEEVIDIWGDGEVVRDHVYITDIIDGIVSCLIHDTASAGAYNLGTGVGYSLNELIELVFKLTGRRTEVQYKEGRAFDVEKIILDHSALSEATGWQPKTSLEEGIGMMWRELMHQERLISS